jgi:hypothetical protein
MISHIQLTNIVNSSSPIPILTFAIQHLLFIQEKYPNSVRQAMRSCGNPKAYIGMAIGVILMVITVYMTIALSQYMVSIEDGTMSNPDNGIESPRFNSIQL